MRPYHCPEPEEKLRRTISMYKALRSKFGGRPLGHATTAEVDSFMLYFCRPARGRW